MTQPTSASKKRSASGQIKYYGVRAGHTPGVFTDYKDVQKSTTGFKGAIFKSFTTQADAQAFAAGKEVASSSASKKAPEKFYGIASGHHPGVYTNWDEAQKQIEGFKGPRYKRFPTREEAEEFVRTKGQPATTPVKPGAASRTTKPSVVGLKVKPSARAPVAQMVDGTGSYDDFDSYLDGPPPSKRSKTSMFESAEKSLREYLDGGEDIQSHPLSIADEGTLRVYTDGSSLGNGREGAIAGVGVYFGPSDPRNISEPLSGPVQTNQRAELTAIFRALVIAPLTVPVEVFTDSQYSISCVTKWFQNWERNGWLSSLKAPVQNKDLIQAVLGKIREREALGSRTNFHWVKGHANDPSNIAVDRLAVAGAQEAMRRRG